MDHKINRDNTAAVATDFYWQPIDAHTPRGVKMLVINKTYGTAAISHIGSDKFWTHWAPLPKWRDYE